MTCAGLARVDGGFGGIWLGLGHRMLGPKDGESKVWEREWGGQVEWVGQGWLKVVH